MKMYLKLEPIKAFQWDGTQETFDKINEEAGKLEEHFESVDDLFYAHDDQRLGAWICISDIVSVRREEPLTIEGLKKLHLQLTG